MLPLYKLLGVLTAEQPIKMASAVDTQYLQFILSVTNYDHDPGGTAAAVITADGGTTEIWLDMRDYTHIIFRLIATVIAAGGFTKFEIVANTESDGSGTTVVVKDSGVIAADALNDAYNLECNHQELAQLGSDNSVELRYISARLTCATATDEAIVAAIALARHQYEDRTPDSQIA